jgi:hypothetical protein
VHRKPDALRCSLRRIGAIRIFLNCRQKATKSTFKIKGNGAKLRKNKKGGAMATFSHQIVMC